MSKKLSSFLVCVWLCLLPALSVAEPLGKNLKQRFDAEHLTIPFPQRTLHMVKADG